MKIRVAAVLTCFVSLASFAAGCESPAYPPYDRAQLLRETTEMLIIPAFTDAASRAGTMRTATAALCATTNATTLGAARTAWTDSFVAYHATIAYQVGPSRTTHLTRLANWPPDLAAVETVVGGTGTIDAAFVDVLPAVNAGYAALEYLLFAYPSYAGPNDAMTLAALGTARRCTLAAMLADRIARLTDQVRVAWLPTGGNHANVFINATDATMYSSRDAAVQVFIGQVAEAIDKVRDDRLGRPLGRTVTRGTAESPYAHASVAAMQACFQSASEAWNGTPHSVDAFLRSRNVRLADSVLAQFATSHTTLAALSSPPLTPAYETYVSGTDHAAGNAAYDALVMLQQMLTSDVGSTLGLSITLPLDGD